jgi:SAM-dependent methyltransferase
MSSQWETDIYSQKKHLNRYPYDSVVTFVYRNAPGDKPRSETRILEVGCGAGNNLWFAAREGFLVTGIDCSPTAIAYAQRRFYEDGLTGDLRVGDFTRLPFENASFDLVIDREALSCVGMTTAGKAVEEAHRVLKRGGKFHWNVYSDQHTSASHGVHGPDGLTTSMAAGTLAGMPDICFWGRERLVALFRSGWTPRSMQHIEIRDEIAQTIHAEWRGVVECS